MITSGTCNAVNTKDPQIMALTTKMNELSSTTKKSDNGRGEQGPITEWRKKCGLPVIERDGVTWYFCENHEGNDYKDLCARHKPEDCQNKKNTKSRREKTDE